MNNDYENVGDVVAAKIHRAVQEAAMDHEPIEGALLVGYVLIAEWVSPKGERWLSRTGGIGQDAQEPLPSWTVKGYLSEAGENWNFEEVGLNEEEGEDD